MSLGRLLPAKGDDIWDMNVGGSGGGRCTWTWTALGDGGRRI